MRYLLIFTTLLFISNIAVSATIIKAGNLEYAGRKLDFYANADPVTGNKAFITSLEFDKNGQGSISVDITAPTFVFSDFGIYHGMLILEPNQTLELKLPPRREKSFADEKNPYFEPVQFWFVTQNKSQLASQISDFTIRLNQLTNKYFDQLYFRQSRKIYDSILYYIDKELPANASDAFNFHKNFSLKMVEAEAFREKPDSYTELFSKVNPEYWLFPAYIGLMERTFNNLLSFEAKSVKGDEIRNAVNGSNTNYLLGLLKDKYKVTGENAQIILLKLLHDAWYSGDFSKKAIETMVNSTVFVNNKNKIVQITSRNINEKITFLQPGNVAPVICLKDFSGKINCTDITAGKFKYIVFADVEMVVCQEHLKYLTSIQERFQKYLEIFIVLRKTDETEMKKFLDANKIPGIKMIDENGEFITKYKIKSFPQCFLLNEKHQVPLVSVKAPLNGFEQQFGTFLQHELFEKQRNQSR